MAHLFQQFKSQQLANYLLKNKIESLKASLNTANQNTTDNIFKACSSFTPRSMPATPTLMSSKETMFQSLIYKGNKTTSFKNNTSIKNLSKLSYLSKDDLELNNTYSSRIKNFKPEICQSKAQKKLIDTKYEKNIKMGIIKKNEYIHKKTHKNKNNSTPNEIQNLNANFSKKHSKEKNVQITKGENAIQNKSLTSTTKTPKSALLDKRRKAVFELLTHEIYPSGKIFYSTINYTLIKLAFLFLIIRLICTNF
jgi:hypothetical protein